MDVFAFNGIAPPPGLSPLRDLPGKRERPQVSAGNTRITLIDDASIEDVKIPPQLVEGVLPGNGNSQIFGAPAVLKSFCGMDLSFHVALGLDWHGRTVARCPVVYIVGEGGFGVGTRVKAWKAYHGITGMIGVYFLRTKIALTAESHDVADLLAEIHTKVSPPPGLVVVDTLSRCIVGDERKSQDMNGYIAGCDRIREELNCNVLSIHHSGHAEGDRGRGASEQPAALDTDIQCTRDGDRVTLKCRKQKDGPNFADLVFEAVPCAGSLVLKPVDQNGGKLDGNRLVCLQAVHRVEGGLTHTQWSKEAGLDTKRSSFNDAVAWLKTQAYVKHTADKKYVPTDAGRLALSPGSTARPRLVQSAPPFSPVQQGGSLVPPGMDEGRFS